MSSIRATATHDGAALKYRCASASLATVVALVLLTILASGCSSDQATQGMTTPVALGTGGTAVKHSETPAGPHSGHVPTASTRRPRESGATGRPMGARPRASADGVNTKERHVVGDGFYSKSQQKCSEIPYPGVVIASYRGYQCWIGTWISRRFGTQGDFYIFGFVPNSRRDVLLAGRANGRVAVVRLREGLGRASMRNFGRYCAVISYAKSDVRSFYSPSSNQLVGFCRWKQ